MNKSGRDKNNRAVFRARNYRPCVSTAVTQPQVRSICEWSSAGMLPFTKKSCAAAEMSDRRLYLTCRLTTGRGLNVRVTSLHRNEHVSNLSLSLCFSLSLLSRKFLRASRVVTIFSRSFHSAPESQTSSSSSSLKKREILLTRNFVVVEREYRGLEIESGERWRIYIYICIYVY